MAQYYNLTLDTLAPQSCTLTVAKTYYNLTDTKTVGINADGASYMYLWTTKNATETEPATITWSQYATSASFTPAGEGTNYVHAVFMDAVGNKSVVINSNSFIYDTTAPTPTEVSINDGASHATSTTVTVTVKVNDLKSGVDAVSGVDYVIFTGDITETGDAAKHTFTDEERASGEIEVTLHLTAITSGEASEVRTITATATDRAGNTGNAVSDDIILDTEVPEATFELQKTSDSSKIIEVTNEVGFKMIITDTSTHVGDVTGYKFWGDIVEHTTEPDTFTSATFPVTVENLNFTALAQSTQAENRTVNVKVCDAAGNVYTIPAQTVLLDQAAPTVVLSKTTGSVVDRISNKSGHNTVALTVSITDDGKLSATTNIDIYGTNGSAGPTKIKTETVTVSDPYTSASKNVSVTYGELETAGLNTDGTVTFVAKVKDKAGNEGTSTETVSVIIDTVGPTGALTVSTLPYSNQGTNIGTVEYINMNAADTSFACTGGDPSGFGTFVAWFDKTATQTTVPAGLTEKDYTAGTAIKASDVNKDSLSDGTDCYLHVRLTDSLGNTSIIHSSAFTYDTTAPGIGTIAFVSGADPLTQRTQGLTLSCTDATTDIKKMKLWGQIVSSESVVDPTASITEADALWIDYATATTVYLQANKDDASNKNKTINVKYMDAAGNVSAGTSVARDLEDVDPSVTYTAYKVFQSQDVEISNGSKVSVLEFKFKPITVQEDEPSYPYSYAIYGDVQNSDATYSEGVWTINTWHAFDSETATTQNVSGLLWSDLDGNKVARIAVKDRNGNIGYTTLSVVLDRTAAVVTISDIQGTVVSLQTGKRRTAAGAEEADVTRNIDGTVRVINNMDMSFFKFSCDEAIDAYKVCVNTPSITDRASIIAAHSIPTTGGSLNMSYDGSVIEASTDISCLIRGADLNADSTVAGVNGVWEIIVFARNTAGEWSAVHTVDVPTTKAVTATATAQDASGNPVTVGTIISTKITDDSSLPTDSIGVSLGTNNDVSAATSFTITADVSQLGDDVTKVDVYQYQ